MKTVKEVKIPAKPAKPARVKEVEIFKCDFCHADIDKSLDNRYGSGSSSCQICRRDVCRKCLIRECNWSGDECDHYCKICHNLWFVIYKEERRQINAKYEQDIDTLNARIKKESLDDKRTSS